LDLESPDLFKTDEKETINLDSVFKNITTLYDKKLMRSVVCILKLMEDESNINHIANYSTGLQSILLPTQDNIKKWIRENLTC